MYFSIRFNILLHRPFPNDAKFTGVLAGADGAIRNSYAACCLVLVGAAVTTLPPVLLTRPLRSFWLTVIVVVVTRTCGSLSAA